MRKFLRYGMAVLLGGLIVGAVFLFVNGANAQDPQADAAADVPISLENVQLDGQFLQYQGQLLDPFTGRPVANGSYQMVFRMYNSASGGAPLWQESKFVVVTDGLFSTLLGDTTPFSLGDFNGQRLWLGTEINGNGETAPRMPIAANAYAIYAENAKLFDGRTVDSFADKKRQPIAYGVVNKDGGREKGWHFSGRGYDSGLGVYRISIDNVHYNVNEYITVVTPVVNPDCPNPVLAATGSKDGDLVVDLERIIGGNVKCKFHFVTYAP
jgi:hypothetical protein